MKTNHFRLRNITGAVILVMGAWCACAQNVGTSITVDGAQPNANAILDVQSPMSGDGKGLLIPRVTLSQRTSANAALAGGLLDNSGHLRGGVAQGLLVYQLDDTTGFYFNTSTSAVPAWAYIGDSTGDVKADGSVSMTGNLNLGGQAVTNGLFFGDGSGLTNVPASGITEVDPLWGAASNAVVTDISSRLLSNTWMSADSTTNYASRVAWIATNTGFQTQIDAKLDSNTWSAADSTTNYTLRTTYNTEIATKLDSNTWSAADSTTNYASRVAWNATNTGFQTQIDAKLDSNTWSAADSTTNYTLRTTYNTEIATKLDSNTWMSADSTTNYASRIDWASTNTGFQTQIDAKLDSNTWSAADSTTNYTLRTTYNTEIATKLDSNTWSAADSTTNYASRVAWNATNSGFQTQIDAKLDSNTWAAADSTTNYTLRTTYNTEIATKLDSNTWMSADSTTNYASRVAWNATNSGLQAQINAAGDFMADGSVAMSGNLNMGGQTLTNVTGTIGFSSASTAVGNGANSDSSGTAIGDSANGSTFGTAIGYSSVATTRGAALGILANGASDGTAVGGYSVGDNFGAACGRSANAATYGAALGAEANAYNGIAVGYQANGAARGAMVGREGNAYNYGSAVGYQANAADLGAALGQQANGYNNGVAVGIKAVGSGKNVALGYQANAGHYSNAANRIAIGQDVTNVLDNTAQIRGNLYLDGATNVMVRSTFGSGAWTPLTETITAGDFMADGSVAMTGALNMNGQAISNVGDVIYFDGFPVGVGKYADPGGGGVAVGYMANGNFDGAALGNQANGYIAGAVLGHQARGDWYGSVVGGSANAQYSGVAAGYYANGSLTNVAVGYYANAQGGSERIAIGHNVTNLVNDSAAIRGNLYLDGATNIMVRPTFGDGAWTPLVGAAGDFKADGTVPMTGNLNMGGKNISGVASNIAFTGDEIAIGKNATADYGYDGVAIGSAAHGDYYGVGVGYQANGVFGGVSMGYQARSYYYGVAVGYQSFATNYGAAVGKEANAVSIGAALGSSAKAQFEGAAVGGNANGIKGGVAMGYYANGLEGGVAIGYDANGASTNIAIGQYASTYDSDHINGGDRIAIGREVTNTFEDSCMIRGTLYLDGGTGVMYRSTFQSGGWTALGGGGGGISSYGYCYQLATVADATVVGDADVPFSNNGPLSGVTHTASTTTMTVPNTGTYKIEYAVTITVGVGAQMALAVNGMVDASTAVDFLVAPGNISGTAMLTLAAGDVITLRNNSATPFTLNLSPAISAQITITQLN